MTTRARVGGALEVHDLSWRPAGRRLPTIDHLDLRLEPGSTVLLAGASGSGKSTVLLALAGLLDDESGDLSGRVDGSARRGLVLQQPEHTVVAETVGRDVAFGPENRSVPRAEIWERVHGVLADLVPDVDEAAGPLETSGGQLQRVSLSGALALDPEVLLLDEPVSMLDPASAHEVREAVATLARERTVVIAEHRVEPWLDLADRLLVLGPQARILADGDPRTLLAEQRETLLAAGLELPAPATAAAQETVTEPATVAEPATAGDADVAEVLALEDVAVVHPDGTGRLLAEHLELHAPPGALVAITGPSGAGKSTLLRLVVGLDEPAGGTVRRPEARRRALVPQNPEHSFVAGTVREEILASPWVSDASIADRLLAATDLAALAAANPFTLSGGEQRRLAIAAALAAQPALLVLDEPTVGLDARRAAAVLDLLDTARAQGCTVVAATHDPVLAARADQRVELAGGPAAQPARLRRRAAPAARLNQLTMLAIGLLAMIGSFAVDSPAVGALVMAPIVALAPLAVRSLRAAVPRVLPTVLAMATVAWSVVLLSPASIGSAAAWELAAREALRIGALVLPGVLMLGSLDPTRLGDALGQRAHLPARIVVGSTAGLAHLSTFRRSWRILMEARRLRGLAPRWSLRPYASATLGMLVTAIRSATVQAIAMDARGFATAHTRTWAMPSPFTAADAVGGAVGLVLLVWPWIARALVG